MQKSDKGNGRSESGKSESGKAKAGKRKREQQQSVFLDVLTLHNNIIIMSKLQKCRGVHYRSA